MLIPGIPLEADDTLDLRALGPALKASEDALTRFRRDGQQLLKLQVWSGKLIATGSENVVYVYILPCRKCKDMAQEDD